MNKLRILLMSSVLLASTAIAQNLAPSTTPAQLLKSAEAQRTVEMIHKVNAYWQANHRAECRGFGTMQHISRVTRQLTN